MSQEPTRKSYNCSKCTAYCCSYDHIELSEKDLERLAAHFGLGVRAAAERFTKRVEGRTRVLRHQKDHIFKSVCMFLDKDKRACTVYDARPKVCRVYPYGNRCGYYSFLRFERKHADDEEMIP